MLSGVSKQGIPCTGSQDYHVFDMNPVDKEEGFQTQMDKIDGKDATLYFKICSSFASTKAPQSCPTESSSSYIIIDKKCYTLTPSTGDQDTHWDKEIKSSGTNLMYKLTSSAAGLDKLKHPYTLSYLITCSQSTESPKFTTSLTGNAIAVSFASPLACGVNLDNLDSFINSYKIVIGCVLLGVGLLLCFAGQRLFITGLVIISFAIS